MSKMLIVCSRNKELSDITKERVAKLFYEFTPEDYTPKAPIIDMHDGIMLGIYNPIEGSCCIDQKHAYIGTFFHNSYDTDVEGEVPDGSFIMTRYNEEKLELVADTAAMYTMWYVITPELFIASSSQKMVIKILGNFDLNKEACYFFFCRGALGVGQSWDKRLDHIRGREQIILNRKTWSIKKQRADVPKQNLKTSQSDEALLNQFKEEMYEALQDIKFDWTKYLITLSGGYDSRLLYLILKNMDPGFRTASWTNVERMDDCYTDGYIAKQLTEHFHTKHSIYYMNGADAYSKEKILRKYINASEGMIDHIGAYMDGMRLYEDLESKGVSGFIRGTQVFGTKNKVDVSNEKVMSDFAYLNPSKYPIGDHLKRLVPYLNHAFEKPEFPKELEQKPEENNFQWGERIWMDYTGHVLFSALNGIKLNYIDIVHPYMSRKIIESCWKLPDHLRADFKSGFRKVVESATPSHIPFARAYATPSVDEICRDNFQDILQQELKTDRAKEILTKELVDFILEGMNGETNIEEIVDKHVNPSFVRMAFRAYIILKMDEILSI